MKLRETLARIVRSLPGLHLSPGRERWDVKTGADAAAASVSLAPVDIAIESLRSIPAPRNATSRVAPVETTVYRVLATLTYVHLEADGDYHCVLTGATGATMIAEAADPAFVAPMSPWLAQIKVARLMVESIAGIPSGATDATKTPNVRVIVVGVGFFDKLHGQIGVAPNGIELHPILSMTPA
jgi:hypothetical protein